MNTVGFVPEPNCGRGTIGIIWSCLTTIFLTTWTATHSKVAATIQKSRRERWLYSAISFFLPEALAGTAVNDIIDAHFLRSAIRRINGWGSFSLKQAFLVTQNGGIRIGDEGPETEALEKRHFLSLANSGRIKFEDFPSGAQIDSRAKADWIGKLVAVLQAFWFLATVLSRLMQGLPVTPLEDITAATACCGLAAFLLYLQCPQDVQERFPIRLKAEEPDYRLVTGIRTGIAGTIPRPLGNVSDSHARRLHGHTFGSVDLPFSFCRGDLDVESGGSTQQ